MCGGDHRVKQKAIMWIGRKIPLVQAFFLCLLLFEGASGMQPFIMNDIAVEEELVAASEKEHDLLRAIKIPFPDSSSMYFDQGLDGIPAFGFFPKSEVKTFYLPILPEKLYPDLTIACTVALKSRSGGFIFAVVNPSETVIQLGVHLLPVDENKLNISLFYTDAMKFSSSQSVATFVVEPYGIRTFVKFLLKVTSTSVSVVYNCKKKPSLSVKRDLEPLNFDSASTLYLAQGGSIMKGNLELHNSCGLNWAEELNEFLQGQKEDRKSHLSKKR